MIYTVSDYLGLMKIIEVLEKMIVEEKKSGSYQKVCELEKKYNDARYEIQRSTWYMKRDEILTIMKADNVSEFWIKKKNFQKISTAVFGTTKFNPDSTHFPEFGFNELITSKPSIYYFKDFAQSTEHKKRKCKNVSLMWENDYVNYIEEKINDLSGDQLISLSERHDLDTLSDDLLDIEVLNIYIAVSNDCCVSYRIPHNIISIVRQKAIEYAKFLINEWTDRKESKWLKDMLIDTDFGKKIAISKLHTVRLTVEDDIIKLKCIDEDYFLKDWINDMSYKKNIIHRIRDVVFDRLLHKNKYNVPENSFNLIGKQFKEVIDQHEYICDRFFYLLSGVSLPQGICDILVEYMWDCTDNRKSLEQLKHTMREYNNKMKDINDLVSNSFHIDIKDNEEYSEEGILYMKMRMIDHAKELLDKAKSLDFNYD